MKLVILDRDGVINVDSDNFIKRPEEWKPIPGSLEAVANLNHAGFHVVVVTNQSGIGRGLFDMTMLNAINQKMIDALGQVGGRLDAVFYCPHAADAGCSCRKPKTGLFEEIGERFNAPLKGIPSVGDSLRDLQASANVSAQPMLVLTGKGAKTLAQGGLPDGTQVFPNLAVAVKTIIQSAQ